MNSSTIHIFLTAFLLSCLFAAWNFMVWQQHGRSFIDSFDHAIARGGLLLAIAGSLAMLTLMSGHVHI